MFFPTFFYWKLHQREIERKREKKTKLFKPKSNPNIHMMYIRVSKITHTTKQHVWVVTMSSLVQKNYKKQWKQTQKWRKNKIRSAVLLNCSFFNDFWPNTLSAPASDKKQFGGHFLVIGGIFSAILLKSMCWKLAGCFLLLGLCGQSIALIKGGPKHQLKRTGSGCVCEGVVRAIFPLH